jgi:predicted RNA-binding Zn ribbon-like protein
VYVVGIRELIPTYELSGFISTPSATLELAKLHKLRLLGWNAFTRIAAKKTPHAADLAGMSESIKWSMQYASMQKASTHYEWVIIESGLELALIRARLGITLPELMSFENLDRSSECGNCTGLILNQGRGVGRRWCRMKTCGNRVKTNRFRGNEHSSLK